MHLRVTYRGNRIQGNIDLPGSKSVANRLLLMRALSGSNEYIANFPDCEDTIVMSELLDLVRKSKGQSPCETIAIDCRNAGTVFRFLTSYLSITQGTWLVFGSERMKERPVGALVDALRSLGASIEYTEKLGYPPLLIQGKCLLGGVTTVQSQESSQFISSLLMIAPVLERGLEIHLTGEKVSEPYIELTVQLMKRNGIIFNVLEDGFFIPSQDYHFTGQTVEKDWSGASCWFETVALSADGEILLNGVTSDSLQGDKALTEIYKSLGVSGTFTKDGLLLQKSGQPDDKLILNLRKNPDLVPSLAVAMAGNRMKGRLSGIEHLRIKESDRLESIQGELLKAGFPIEIEDNNLFFNGLQVIPHSPIRVFSHNDHRILMAMAPLALKTNELYIEDPIAVNKSYPGFWNDLQNIGFQVIEV